MPRATPILNPITILIMLHSILLWLHDEQDRFIEKSYCFHLPILVTNLPILFLA